MTGKVFVVTGSNSGVGLEMARQLGQEPGATVVLVARNAAKLEAAREDLARSAPGAKYETVVADLSVMAEVRRAASEIRARHPKVDVLANNAGLYLPARRVTAEGNEFMWAVNHLAPFLLTHELLDCLLAAAPARVVTTSSAGHSLGHLELDDLQMERRFKALRQYCNTKLGNVLFTRELARRLKGRGIVAHAFHPGVVRTGFAQDESAAFGWLVRLGAPFMRGPVKAARTGTHLCVSEDAATSSGDYWVDSKRRKPSPEARNDALAGTLWEVTERMVGLEAPGRIQSA